LQLPDGRVVKEPNARPHFINAEQYNDIELIYYVNYPTRRKERLVHGISDAVFLPL